MRNFLPSIIILLTIFGCHDSLSSIEGCCEEPALHATVGNGTVYVQNVFSPNGDGVNDQLIIYGDSIRQFVNIKIKNRNGSIVYEKEDFLPNDVDAAWNGEFAGRLDPGLYTFTLKAEAEN